MGAREKKSAITADDVVKMADKLLVVLRDESRKQIAEEMRGYRESYVRTGKWCCEPMTHFAKRAWSMPNPSPPESSPFGSIRLELFGRSVIFCPFCGVKL